MVEYALLISGSLRTLVRDVGTQLGTFAHSVNWVVVAVVVVGAMFVRAMLRPPQA